MLCWFQVYSKVNQLYTYPLFFQIIFPYWSLQSIEQNSLCFTVGPYQLSILYIAVWTCQFPSPYFGASVIKTPPANAGAAADSGSIPGSGRSPGGGNGSTLQDSCLEKLHEQRSLVGYKESDTTECLSTHMYSLPIYPSPQLMVTIW